MSDSVRELIERHHAYYEVLPYYVMIEEEEHGLSTGILNRVQAGFDVDVHGLRAEGEPDVPIRPDYLLGYSELKKIADSVAQRAGGCFIEVIPFYTTVFQEARQQFRPEAIIRIQISHRGNVDQPAGPPEQSALQELENQLQSLGILRR